jgi:hypothetical protein
MRRPSYQGSYLNFVINLAVHGRTPMGRYIEHVQAADWNIKQCMLDKMIAKVQIADSGHRLDYKMINPLCIPHTVYSKTLYQVPEHLRIAFTRARLGSHHLRIETGRWSRISRENRLCICGQVQTVVHVLISCVYLQDLRNKNGIVEKNISDLMEIDQYKLCKFIKNSMDLILSVNN